MTINELDKLATLIKQSRPTLLARWRQQVRQLPSARQMDIPALNDHIPSLLDELAVALQSKSDQTIPEALCQGSPPAHGLQRVQDAFNIEEVVAEYNILRGCIHDLAEENGLHLRGKPFHVINRVLDQAIGLALQTYATQRALEVQQRREDYLAFVAHDLRTPLNAISLAGKVLEQTLPKQGRDPVAAQMLKALRRNARYLEALVDKVLEENLNLQTEVGVKLERRKLDLWPFAEALIHDLRPVAAIAGTELTNEVPEDLVVYADAILLKRVFQNLIVNAIKFTQRGKVIIGARDLGVEDVVECWVSDNGAGIPEELRDKIFDKGETDPENPDGTGLGLAIVKAFTEAHGGKVTVESQQGVGSLFRISLPTEAGVNNKATRADDSRFVGPSKDRVPATSAPDETE